MTTCDFRLTLRGVECLDCGASASTAKKLFDDCRRVIHADAYAALRRVLDAAHDQAASGKGAERHADGASWCEQPIFAITRQVGLGFPAGQAMKKIGEAIGMVARGDHGAAYREVLGAIVYAAALAQRIDEIGSGGASQPVANTFVEAAP